ncbi:MAG: hypothetical protein LBE35_05510 [Clostridiales bacterium]|jgi:hypothetical protein|nr:hypothetical protein [Clostridiales bacterium]
MAIRFIFKHIIRSPWASLLSMMIALFSVVSLIWLQNTIWQAEDEIAQLYDSTPIRAEIRRIDPWMATQGPNGDMALMENIVSQLALDNVIFHRFVEEAYIISGMHLFNIVRPGAGGGFDRAILEDIWSLPGQARQRNFLRNLSWEHDNMDWHLAVSCLETLQNDSLDILFPSFEIEFAQGFGYGDFVFQPGQPIPVILHEEIALRRGLELSDFAFIANNPEIGNLRDFYQEAIVIGIYYGETEAGFGHRREHPYVILPLEAMEYIMGARISYTTARITFATAYNHHIPDFIEQVQIPLAQNFFNVGVFGLFIPLEIIIFDEEFRLVVAPMEQNLNLLNILFPLAIAVAIAIGAGMSILLLYQNTKPAAIMRALGMAKPRAVFILSARQIITKTFGIALGIIAALALNLTISIVFLAFLLGAIIGSFAGAAAIVRRPPLELLQVKE